MDCIGCGEGLNPVMAALSVNDGIAICMGCVRQRARTVGNNGRCTCIKRLKRPRRVKTVSREWDSCDRCLGAIRQIK